MCSRLVGCTWELGNSLPNPFPGTPSESGGRHRRLPAFRWADGPRRVLWLQTGSLERTKLLEDLVAIMSTVRRHHLTRGEAPLHHISPSFSLGGQRVGLLTCKPQHGECHRFRGGPRPPRRFFARQEKWRRWSRPRELKMDMGTPETPSQEQMTMPRETAGRSLGFPSAARGPFPDHSQAPGPLRGRGGTAGCKPRHRVSP